MYDMLLIRTLHPSGHGTFFTEIILQEGKDDFIVVHDCGAFDRDHVNGIELLKPYITNVYQCFCELW